MKQLTFTKCEFERSLYTAKQYQKLQLRLPQIAVIGRSNVGKSSLLNYLFRNNSLAKVSQKPGKTQSINFYLVDQMLHLVDLPGYGFASTGNTQKKQWTMAIEDYFQNNDSLKALFLLLDCRREKPSKEDAMMVEWLMQLEIPCMILFTKTDKLSKNQAASNMSKVLKHLKESLNFKPLKVEHCSTKTLHARKPLITSINQLLKDL